MPTKRVHHLLSTYFSPFWNRVARRCWMGFALFMVVIAIVFSLFRALTPWVKQYKPQLEAELSAQTQQTVTIQAIQTSWYWFIPVLRMDRVRLTDQHAHIVQFEQMMVGIDLWHSLWARRLLPDIVYLDGTHLHIKQTESAWDVNGFQIPTNDSVPTQDVFTGLLGAVFSQEKIIIKHMDIDVALCNGAHIPIQGLNFKMVNRGNQYRMLGVAHALFRRKPTDIALVADVMMTPPQVQSSSGQVYLALQHLDARALKDWLPSQRYALLDGRGNLKIWFDLKHGRVEHLQSVVELAHLQWRESESERMRNLDKLHANVAWKRQTNGWKIEADKIVLRLNDEDWPQNEVMVTKSNNAYRAYVKSLSVAQTVRLDLPWPDFMQKILVVQPTGTIHNIQLGWEYGQLNYVLMQFSNLSWQTTPKIPALTGLSGALYWQPMEGRLEVDGEHTQLTPLHHLSPMVFDTFNAAFEWKMLSHGLRLSMERLVLSHPNMVLSANGAIDNPGQPLADLRLNINFAAKNAEMWLPYVPDVPDMPSFNRWLKKTGIPHIDRAVGRVVVRGPVADFPFDHGEGVFTVDAHVNGLDLLIDKDWPANRAIDANIRVQNRRLEADVVQASILGIPLRDINIAVPDIGLNKEVFLLNGQVNVPGKTLKSYILQSPLRTPLARWLGIDINDALDLDLQLEVPLSSDTDPVLTRGKLTFHNNPVSVKTVDNSAKFSDVDGDLQFNESGLTAGHLEGSLVGYPFSLHVHPISTPVLGTALDFAGEVSMRYLNHLVHIPMLAFTQGQMIVSGMWTFYSDPKEADTLTMSTSLAGVAIHLPKPFQKSTLSVMPLTAHMRFLSDDAVDLSLTYDQLMHGTVHLQKTPDQGWKEAGDIYLGTDDMALPAKHKGLRIKGTLAYLDSDAWGNVINHWPKESSSMSLWDNVQDLEFVIGEARMLKQSYTHLKFNAHQLEKKRWSGEFKQAKIEGNYAYTSANNTLSIHFNRLMITPQPHGQSQPKVAFSEDIRPNSFPNFNISIDHCLYHDVDLGQMAFKTKSDPQHWILQQGTITSDDYQLALSGDWTVENTHHRSNVQAQLRLRNLAKTLQHWHFTPAVDAHSGQIDLEGHWNTPFYAFSLSKVEGQVHLVLRDGRISHLDKETEKKLGLGKLLSILSLQTIPRRLKLDFSDLSEKGYSFDVIKGSFQVKHGVMTTNDSYIDGPVAFARMEGDLDLVKQLYDLNLRMTPYIGASLPVVVAIAGAPVAGPVAGIATWVALKFINQGMQKISAYTYKISGPWNDPVVQQVSIVKSAH